MGHECPARAASLPLTALNEVEIGRCRSLDSHPASLLSPLNSAASPSPLPPPLKQKKHEQKKNRTTRTSNPCSRRSRRGACRP